jgi:ceramide glucosyltransferase
VCVASSTAGRAVLEFIFWAIFLITVLSTALISFYIYVIRKYFRKPAGNGSAAASLSLIVPIKGTDTNTEHNLELVVGSESNTPVEFLFAMETEDDPAYQVCCNVKAKNPDKDIHIILTGPPKTFMGKQHNLGVASEQAKYEILANMDADVQVEKDTLQKGLQAFNNPQVGLVWFFPYYYGSGPLGGTLVANYFNNFFNVLVGGGTITKTNPVISGALWMMPRTLFVKCRENDRLVKTVSDDRELGYTIKELGYETHLVPTTVKMPNENLSFLGGVKHLSKWYGMLRAEGLGFYTVILFLFNPILMSLITLWIANAAGGSKSTWMVFTVALVTSIKIGGVYSLNKTVYKIPPATNTMMTLIYDIFILPVLYFVNINRRHIVWKGKKYKLGKNGKILDISL